MSQFTRRVLFFLFFASGFCSLVYQVVWTRMAFAAFGIITPVLSVVLSVFMLGLAIGSWLGGRWIHALVKKSGQSAALFYAGTELLIGLGAFVVPKLFFMGERILLSSGETNSFGYLLFSALILAVAILPWCVCMGATFPFMMAYVREQDSANTKSFSFLYLANVLGAMSGTFLTAIVFIELWGFHHTLWQAAGINFAIAFISGCLAWERRRADVFLTKIEEPTEPETTLLSNTSASWFPRMILFSTGFSAMAMEVVWTRAFTPALKTQVYSFALIVFTYLGATFLGSLIYRLDRKRRFDSIGKLISGLVITAFFPILANDPKFVTTHFWTAVMDAKSAIILMASICPFCILLGYLTPRLIDEYAAGQPKRAGSAYAINVSGCILGPLFACYVLLPFFSERDALILLTLPFLIFWFVLCKSLPLLPRWGFGLSICAALVWSSFFSKDFADMLVKTQSGTTVRRDYAASVISFTDNRNCKWLLVNGIGMTSLTPITKFMVHLPLALHKEQPESALVICFGMGTSYRSALSWNIETTVVELIPSVPKAFGFYHANAETCINNPKGHIIIDDGRRYLNRCGKKFDVIVVDPPPPVEAAGSSLLYSREFYIAAKQHLNPGGILQMWFPGADIPPTQAVLRSIYESFPYVRCFPSVEGWGIHLLASSEPIELLDAQQLAARMPESAREDLLEWNSSKNAPAYIQGVVTNEFPILEYLNPDPQIQITDDQPFNEYFLLRNLK